MHVFVGGTSPRYYYGLQSHLRYNYGLQRYYYYCDTIMAYSRICDTIMAYSDPIITVTLLWLTVASFCGLISIK
jgi:hypothetical protein